MGTHDSPIRQAVDDAEDCAEAYGLKSVVQLYEVGPQWRATVTILFPAGVAPSKKSHIVCSGYGKAPMDAIQNLYESITKAVGL